MGIAHHIERLKQKPETHRRKVALLASGGCMLVIAAIWVVTFPARFPDLFPPASAEAAAIVNSDQAQTQTDDSSNTASAESPIQSLGDQFNNGIQSTNQNSYNSDTNTQASDSPSLYVSNGVTITNPGQ